jgi:hypothetical protein
MSQLGKASASLAVVFVVALSGCTSSNPAPTPTPSPPNLSGDYAGTMTDSVAGTGSAAGTLAQTGNTVGGTIAFSPASGTLDPSLSLKVATSDAVSGAMVIDYPNNGPTCSYSVTGTYDANTGVLSGSYSAVTNCSGESGTFSLTQQCTDTITGHVRRAKVGGIAPC